MRYFYCIHVHVYTCTRMLCNVLQQLILGEFYRYSSLYESICIRSENRDTGRGRNGIRCKTGWTKLEQKESSPWKSEHLMLVLRSMCTYTATAVQIIFNCHWNKHRIMVCTYMYLHSLVYMIGGYQTNCVVQWCHFDIHCSGHIFNHLFTKECVFTAIKSVN